MPKLLVTYTLAQQIKLKQMLHFEYHVIYKNKC